MKRKITLFAFFMLLLSSSFVMGQCVDFLESGFDCETYSGDDGVDSVSTNITFIAYGNITSLIVDVDDDKEEQITGAPLEFGEISILAREGSKITITAVVEDCGTETLVYNVPFDICPEVNVCSGPGIEDFSLNATNVILSNEGESVKTLKRYDNPTLVSFWARKDSDTFGIEISYSTDNRNWSHLRTYSSGNFTEEYRKYSFKPNLPYSASTKVYLKFTMINRSGLPVFLMNDFEVQCNPYGAQPIFTTNEYGQCHSAYSNDNIVDGGTSSYTYINVQNNTRTIAAINSNGQDLGNIAASVYISSFPREENDVFYLDRTIYLSPSRTPTSPVDVRIYFTDEELQNLIDASLTNQNEEDDASFDNLVVIKVHGETCFGDGVIIPVGMENETAWLGDATLGTDDVGRFLEVTITEFSSFSIRGFLDTTLPDDPFDPAFDEPFDPAVDTTGGVTGTTVTPVELTSFTAKETVNGQVELNWETATEDNNDYFELLRSVDGLTFSPLGKVAGNGTTTQTHNYSYVDTLPFAGLNYYQLKQVDFDGTTDDSNIVLIDVGMKELGIVALSKNTVTINAQERGVGQVQIYNLEGKVVAMVPFELMETNQVIPLNTSLLTGVYFVKVQLNTIEVVAKFVVQ